MRILLVFLLVVTMISCGEHLQKMTLNGGRRQVLIEKFFGMKNKLLNQKKYAHCKKFVEKLKSVKDRDEILEINEKINQLAPKLEREVKAAQLDLIKKNENYFVVKVFPFIQELATADQIKEIYALLPEASKQKDNVVEVMQDLKIKESIQPGRVAPNFTLKTPDGNELSLRELKGQVVLLDFWASWCKPCRASFPHLKELYKKYHRKGFEIIGITNDFNHDAWKKAIKDDEIPWLNVADDFPEEYKQAKVISAYGMDFLPSTVLIDREGIIIAKLLHGKELEHRLKEIFGF